MPSQREISGACLLQTPAGKASTEHAGNGFPKMPFKKIGWEAETTLSGVGFPDSLRLRPGYAFSQKEEAPPEN